MDENKQRLIEIITANDEIMAILRLARSFNLPNWYIGAGLIRNAVWDVLASAQEKSPIRDVDFIYYSRDAINEESTRQRLMSVMPDIQWDVKNSATVHTWYKEKRNIDRPPLRSSEEDIDMWPETSSAIGIRLEANDELTVYAPCGLNDLMHMVFRRNKKNSFTVTPEIFKKRVRDKHIVERWSGIKVIYD